MRGLNTKTANLWEVSVGHAVLQGYRPDHILEWIGGFMQVVKSQFIPTDPNELKNL